MQLREFIQKMPKVELHLHLEGTICPQTAFDFMHRNNPSAAPLTPEQVRNLYRFRNLAEFIRGMRTVSNNIVEIDDLRRVTCELFGELRAQNVRYVEFDVALQKYIERGMSLRDVVETIHSCVPCQSGIDAYMIVNLQRDRGPQKAVEMVEAVAELDHPFIVGIGLSGDENRYRPGLFTDAFRIAREKKLHLTAHAGEAAGPASVWGALRDLKVERIDHGTQAIDDDTLVEYLVQHKIPLTQCLSSNLRLNVVENIASHPFYEFYRRGVPVTLNTDDPQVFGVSLTEEYERAASAFDLDRHQLGEIALNGIRAAFAPSKVRERVRTEMERELRELGAQIRSSIPGSAESAS